MVGGVMAAPGLRSTSDLSCWQWAQAEGVRGWGEGGGMGEEVFVLHFLTVTTRGVYCQESGNFNTSRYDILRYYGHDDILTDLHLESLEKKEKKWTDTRNIWPGIDEKKKNWWRRRLKNCDTKYCDVSMYRYFLTPRVWYSVSAWNYTILFVLFSFLLYCSQSESSCCCQIFFVFCVSQVSLNRSDHVTSIVTETKEGGRWGGGSVSIHRQPQHWRLIWDQPFTFNYLQKQWSGRTFYTNSDGDCCSSSTLLLKEEAFKKKRTPVRERLLAKRVLERLS